MSRKLCLPVAALIACLAIASNGLAATLAWTEFTFQDTSGGPFTSNNGDQKDVTANPPANLLSVTTSEGTFTNLVFTESSSLGSIVGNNLSTGAANPAGSYDAIFELSPNSIDDDNLLLTDFGGDDTFTARLLDENGPIGDELTITSDWTDVADGINDTIEGALVDLADFNAAVPASDIIGVRINQTGPDSAERLDPLVIGLATLNPAPVPEPASIAIWSLLGLALTGFGYVRIRRKK